MLSSSSSWRHLVGIIIGRRWVITCLVIGGCYHLSLRNLSGNNNCCAGSAITSVVTRTCWDKATDAKYDDSSDEANEH